MTERRSPESADGQPRFAVIDPAKVAGHVHALLEQGSSRFGRTPNLLRVMANSPEVLEGYLALDTSLRQGTLGGALRERIAIMVAEAYGSAYCLAMHRLLGKLVGLSESEIQAARNARSSDPVIAAALAFAVTLVTRDDAVTDMAVTQMQQVGYTDAQIVEIVAEVALNSLAASVTLVTHIPLDAQFGASEPDEPNAPSDPRPVKEG